MPNAELFLVPQNTSQIYGLHCCFRLGLLSGVSLFLLCVCCAVSHGLMLINLVFAFLFTFNIKFYFCSICLFSLCNSLLVFSVCDIPLCYSVARYIKLISDSTQLNSVLFDRMTCLQTILENKLR
jgi:predicted membrane metal-binding protein